MNSLTVRVAANTTTATMRGNISGMTARTNAPTRPYPSTMARSSVGASACPHVGRNRAEREQSVHLGVVVVADVRAHVEVPAR
jgi:hypothetical protein